jgi:hypothetical protein
MEREAEAEEQRAASSGTTHEGKERKARCRDQVPGRDVRREEGQKKYIRSHGRAGPTAWALCHQPYISSEPTMAAMAHYRCWVTMFEDRALQRCVWTSFLWRHFSVVVPRSNRAAPTPPATRHGTAPP